MTTLADAAATDDFGRRIAAALGVFDAGLVVSLAGELGAGKTALARAVIQALGHHGHVVSPSYTLVEPYAFESRTLYHLDLYRVADPGELEYLGLREMLSEDATLLIEWAERGEGWLPQPDLRILIRHRGEGRDIELKALTTDGERLIDVLGSTSSSL